MAVNATKGYVSVRPNIYGGIKTKDSYQDASENSILVEHIFERTEFRYRSHGICRRHLFAEKENSTYRFDRR